MTTKTKQTTEFDLLDPETIEVVPDLREPDGPGKEIHEAVRFHRDLEAKRKELIEALRTLPTVDGPSRRFDSKEDARAILAGGSVDSLTAPSASDRRATATRQLHAVEAALGGAQVAIGDTARRVVAAQSAKIEQPARAVLADVVDAAETLLDCLHAWQQFLRLCDVRGLKLADGRPGWMQLQGLESNWVEGSPYMPHLEYYIRSRRETAGLDVQSEKGW